MIYQGFRALFFAVTAYLYINDSGAFLLTPQNQIAEAAPVQFAAFVAYHGPIDRITMVPVLEKGGENPEEMLVVYRR